MAKLEAGLAAKGTAIKTGKLPVGASEIKEGDVGYDHDQELSVRAQGAKIIRLTDGTVEWAIDADSEKYTGECRRGMACKHSIKVHGGAEPCVNCRDYIKPSFFEPVGNSHQMLPATALAGGKSEYRGFTQAEQDAFVQAANDKAGGPATDPVGS